MPELVITEFMDAGAVDRLRDKIDLLYDPGLVDDRGLLADAMREAAGLIVRNRTRVTKDLIAQAPKLRVVGRLGVGLDNIDLDACAARDIAVHPATGANAVSVAEYVIAAMLTLVRGAYGATDQVASGAWPRNMLVGGEVHGRTLGLVGLGATARKVAARARALGMTIAAYDPFLPEDHAAWQGIARMDFPTLMAAADVVSLHVPLTEATRHLVDAAVIRSMRPGAVIINSARGGVIDEAALIAALREERLGGGALDVFEHEPVSADAGRAFAGVPNLLLTPHIAGVTGESNVRISNLIADKIIEALAQLKERR